MRVVIIGNGAAGVSAAEAVRAKAADAEIIMLSDEPHRHYSRPRVIEFLSGKIPAEEIMVKKKEWYAAEKIDFRASCRVTRIDTAGKKLETCTGGISYDRLIIAAGAHSFIPPVPGANLPGVFGLRTIEDAEKIISFAKGKKEAAVIGGGLLGIEAAMSLSTLGLKTTVIEFFDRLLPRQLDPEGAAMLKTMLEARGLSFLLPRKSKEIRSTGNGLEIVFETEGSVPADMVLFSAGIRCNLGITEGSGMETDKGIKVSDRLETNVKGVFAAGDIAEYNGAVYGIWPAAKEQGAVAGASAAGAEASYKGSVLSTKLKVAGIDLASAGETEEKPGDEVIKKSGEDYYGKLIMRDGKLAGIIMVGGTKEYVKAQKLIKSGESAGDFAAEFRKA